MKILIVLVLLVSLSACKKESPQTEPSSKYTMNCEVVGHYVVRCENQEAVCYGSNAGYLGSSTVLGEAGIFCNFKK